MHWGFCYHKFREVGLCVFTSISVFLASEWSCVVFCCVVVLGRGAIWVSMQRGSFLRDALRFWGFGNDFVLHACRGGRRREYF